MPVCTNEKYEKLLKSIRLVKEHKLDKDKFSRWLFTAYIQNHISRREYHDLFNELEKNLHHFCDTRELSNIMKRMDWRTLGEFALTIYDNTKREKILAESWVDICTKKHLFEQATLEDNGMSNNGIVMFGLRGVNHEPDFKITVIDSNLPDLPTGVNKLEVKYCPSSAFLTYKEADLKSYISKDSYVLTVMGENKMLGANGNPDSEDDFTVDKLNIVWWSMMSPATMRQMLTDLPVRCYYGYMGNKPCVRLYKNEHPRFDDFFTLQAWH